MREYAKRQVQNWFDTTTTTTTTTTPSPTTKTTATVATRACTRLTTPPPTYKDLVKRKLQSWGDWCKGCFKKAKNALKEVLGIEDVYGSKDNIDELV